MYYLLHTDLEKTSLLLLDIIGRVPNFFRYPYQSYNQETDSLLAKLDYRSTEWSIDTNDWRSMDPLHNDLIPKLENSNFKTDSHIMLAHDVQQSTFNQIQGYIDAIKKYGYRFVTLGECLDDVGGEYRNHL